MTQTERDRLLMKIDIGLNGNGSKGLIKRVDELEEWKDKRPQDCPAKPLSQSDIMKRRAFEVALMAVLLSALQFIAKLAGLW